MTSSSIYNSLWLQPTRAHENQTTYAEAELLHDTQASMWSHDAREGPQEMMWTRHATLPWQAAASANTSMPQNLESNHWQRAHLQVDGATRDWQLVQQPAAAGMLGLAAIPDSSTALAGVSGNWPSQNSWNAPDACSARRMPVANQGHQEVAWTRRAPSLWQETTALANTRMPQNFESNHWQQTRLHLDGAPRDWQQPSADAMLGLAAIADSSNALAGECGNWLGQISLNQAIASGVGMPAKGGILQEVSWTQRSESPLQEKVVLVDRSMQHSSDLNHWQHAHLNFDSAPDSMMSPEDGGRILLQSELHIPRRPAVAVPVTTPGLELDAIAEGICSDSRQDALQESPLSDEDHGHDGAVHDAVNLPPRRRRRQHRGGRRRRRGVARRAERQTSGENALTETHNAHEAHAAASPTEMSKDLWAVQCMEQLDSGNDEQQCTALAALRGRVLELSFQPQGCRVIQLALQVASLSEVDDLLNELQGQVRAAVESPHANHVVQKVVEVLPSAKTAFVPEELLGVAVLTASHRYGCRIVCRIVEHPGSDQRIALIAELLGQTQELCRSVYGHHVIGSILEHGTWEQRKTIAAAVLSAGVVKYAKNRHASYVVEKALELADQEDRELLMAELLRDPETLPMLAESQFGHHVVKALIRNAGGYSQTALSYLAYATQRLEVTKFGKRLLEEFASSFNDWSAFDG
mmetsp:Transcript_70539/g.130014  ORF Transcript_70539/g.130014 Transcript_70539/m.130014 type:complete len:695 (+) Transcript_70539:82-2166(+)